MKAKKVLGLALSAMMAISAVVPWTGLTATAAEEPQVANASQQMEERKRPPEGANVVLKGATVTFVTKDGNKVGTKEVGRGDLKIADPTYKYDGDVWFWTAKTSVTLKSPGNHVPDGYEYVSCDSPKTVSLTWDWTHWDVVGKVNFTVVVKEKEPEFKTFYVNYYKEGTTSALNSTAYVDVPVDTTLEEMMNGPAYASYFPATLTADGKTYEKVEAVPATDEITINVYYKEVVEQAVYGVNFVSYPAEAANISTQELRVIEGNTIPAGLPSVEYDESKWELVNYTVDGEVIDLATYKVTSDVTVTVNFKRVGEAEPEPETWWYNVQFYLNGESKGSQAFTVETSTDTAVVDIASLPAFTDEFEGATYDHDASSADNAIKNDDGTFTISGSDTAMIYAYFTKEETVDPEPTTYTVTFKVEDGVTGPTLSFDTKEVEEGKTVEVPVVTYDDTKWEFNGWFYEDGTQANLFAPITADTALVAMFTEKETPVEPTKWSYTVKYYLDGKSVITSATVDEDGDGYVNVPLDPKDERFENAKFIQTEAYDAVNTSDDGESVTFQLQKDGALINVYYETEDAPAQDKTINLTFVDADDQAKVLGTGAAVLDAGQTVEEFLNMVYPIDSIIEYAGEKYAYTGSYTSTENETAINATLLYRKVTPVAKDKTINLTFVDADDQTKVLGTGAGVVVAGQTVEEFLNMVYPIDSIIEYAGEKYAYTGANSIVEDENSFTATLLYRKAEVVEKDREIQLTFVDIDSNKTLGHGAGVVPAGEASEAWIYNVYNGDVITFENEKYTYTGANTIVENETSITATLYYKKAEVVGEDKEIQLTFVDADDQTKVLGHGAGVVLAGQTVEEWLNEVYPIGDVIEYAGAKYAYTGANAIVEGEDSFTATLLYRKTEALEKDKEIQLIFVDADNQTKVLGRGAGVVLAGQSIEEWLDEVYPIGDVITYKNEEYVYTGSKSVVEGEDSITATLLYRKDTDPTDPDEPDDPDPDRPSSGGGYYPSRPDDEEIDDPTTPEASNPGDGSGSAGPGGAGDGAVPVEDPGEELGDGNVPLVEAPQTGRKIAGSIALLAGAAVVAVVTLKKRKDK